MIRKLSAVLLALSLMLCAVLSVSGYELPDLTRRGSLTFAIEYGGSPLNGGALSITRVGEILEENGEYRYALLPALQPGPSLDDLADAELAEMLRVLAEDKELPAQSAPIADGKAEFSDLDLGLYLVTQPENDATPGYSPISSFLITIPQYADGYLYEVTAKPKQEPTPQPTEPPTAPPTTEPPTTPSEPGLPQTGQLNWPIPFLFVFGMALFAMGWYLCFGKKEHYEK
ncbi:MAG: hypothetical protein IJ001_11100 [Oscillospiraceae bacterium]|nr:hypothetical protein [Oscillospiraceae bacterium]